MKTVFGLCSLILLFTSKCAKYICNNLYFSLLITFISCYWYLCYLSVKCYLSVYDLFLKNNNFDVGKGYLALQYCLCLATYPVVYH